MENIISSNDKSVKTLPKGYILGVPVWGDDYVKQFLEISLPSLLSPRNLPVLQGRPICKFNIYTKSEWVNTIKQASTITYLTKFIEVKIHELDLDTSNRYYGMNEGHRLCLEEANGLDCASMMLSADHIYSDGYVEFLVNKAEEGYRVVSLIGLRTNRNSMGTFVKNNFKTGEVITISPRQLVKAAVNNLHEINEYSFMDSNRSLIQPSSLFWTVGKSGEILAHCYHQSPVMVYPEIKNQTFKGTIDDDLVTSVFKIFPKDYVIANSDECIMIDLCQEGREVPLIEKEISQIAHWVFYNTNIYHKRIFEFKLRLHFGEAKEEEWIIAEQKAKKVLEKIKNRIEIITLKTKVEKNEELLNSLTHRIETIDRSLRPYYKLKKLFSFIKSLLQNSKPV